MINSVNSNNKMEFSLPKTEVQYIILIRHRARDKSFNVSREKHNLQNLNKPSFQTEFCYKIADNSIEGYPQTLQIAGWFSEG